MEAAQRLLSVERAMRVRIVSIVDHLFPANQRASRGMRNSERPCRLTRRTAPPGHARDLKLDSQSGPPSPRASVLQSGREWLNLPRHSG